MRVVALISGGKDSTYNLLQCVAAGHEVVALANLQPGNCGNFFSSSVVKNCIMVLVQNNEQLFLHS